MVLPKNNSSCRLLKGPLEYLVIVFLDGLGIIPWLITAFVVTDKMILDVFFLGNFRLWNPIVQDYSTILFLYLSMPDAPAMSGFLF